jgi:hypothetical protein
MNNITKTKYSLTPFYMLDNPDYKQPERIEGPTIIVELMEKRIINIMSKKLKISRHTALSYLRKKTGDGNGIQTAHYLNLISGVWSRKSVANVFGITLDERND